ncbi:hypothetical protein [Trebonia sp.]|uniref:hypothetical protein n=1 Tax=Trebonia sp. TaxID=2767075 RepID=UPI0026350915|nr:hypothetical protein [Trebonia sp.]
MNVWRVLRLLAVLWLLKRAFRLLRALILTAIVVALWPVTLTAAVAAFAAWLRGWPPARLYWAAAWSAPVTAVYLIAAALQARSWRAVALARLAHIRAVLAARLWLESGQAYQDGRAWWRSERRIRAALASNAGAAHLPDAEIHWPSIDASPYAGQVWAVEAELTPKPAARTLRIMGGLLSPPRYAQVVYLTAPAARPVVIRAAAELPAPLRGRVSVRDLPSAAFLPGVPR